MDRDQQLDLQARLAQTLEDGVLSRNEQRDFKKIIAEIQDQPQALAFVRNSAYKLAKSMIEESPAQTLDWLQRIDKQIDNARRSLENAASNQTPKHEMAFSPGEECLLLLIQSMQSAKKAIDICVFTVTDDRLTEVILSRHRAGVRVRVITDDEKQFDSGSDIRRLSERGVPVKVDPYPNHMHHKFAIFDDNVLATGSYNWTRGATKNHENLLILRDTDIAQPYLRTFESLWASFPDR